VAGRPPFEPDPAQRLMVTALCACGTRLALIASHIGIDTKTLRRHFRKELAEGRQDANALVARSLFDQAIGGCITAQIFWLKTRAGWRETNTVEMVGANGRPLIPGFNISWADGGPGLPLVSGAVLTTENEAEDSGHEHARIS
jgi:hypothetical protein